MMSDQAILVTGAAGFIGFHVAQRLLQSGHRVVGVDNLNAYYDPRLKAARLDILRNDPRFQFERLDVADRVAMPALFARIAFPSSSIWPHRRACVSAQRSARLC